MSIRAALCIPMRQFYYRMEGLFSLTRVGAWLRLLRQFYYRMEGQWCYAQSSCRPVHRQFYYRMEGTIYILTLTTPMYLSNSTIEWKVLC